MQQSFLSSTFLQDPPPLVEDSDLEPVDENAGEDTLYGFGNLIHRNSTKSERA